MAPGRIKLRSPSTLREGQLTCSEPEGVLRKQHQQWGTWGTWGLPYRQEVAPNLGCITPRRACTGEADPGWQGSERPHLPCCSSAETAFSIPPIPGFLLLISCVSSIRPPPVLTLTEEEGLSDTETPALLRRVTCISASRLAVLDKAHFFRPVGVTFHRSSLASAYYGSSQEYFVFLLFGQKKW